MAAILDAGVCKLYDRSAIGSRLGGLGLRVRDSGMLGWV